MNKGFIWTAYGSNHEPLKGYRQLFALNLIDAHDRFSREYGNDSSIAYLVPDTFNQWENLSDKEIHDKYHNPRECWFDCEYGDDRNYD